MNVRWPKFSLRSLSAEETAELATRVAELTKAGLPLGDGLRALGDELSGRRLRRVLLGLANRIDAGDDLVQAMESQGAALPTHLRGLVIAGVRSGRLPEVLEEFVDLERSRSDLRRRVAMSMAYPAILVVFMVSVLVVGHFYILPGFGSIFADFKTKLPDITVLVLSGSGPALWIGVALLAILLLVALTVGLSPLSRWAASLARCIPMLGPLLRSSHLATMSRMMGLALEQQVALPDALRLTAVTLHDRALARGCLKVADEVEQGRPLDESMAAEQQFPPSLIPIVGWGRRTTSLADAFRAAAEMFEGRTRMQSSLWETLLLPIMLVVIIVFVGFLVVALMLPLIELIKKLS